MASESRREKSELPAGAGLHAVIEEFARLLDIFSGQLAESLQEADRECMAVGESFHALEAARSRIAAIECPEPGREVLRDGCTQIGESLAGAVVALQYHDRLAQRVGHIRVGLNHLQGLLRHQSIASGEEWLKLLRNVELSYHHEWSRLARPAPPSAAAGGAEPHADQSAVELF
jgi:hypothetical protein